MEDYQRGWTYPETTTPGAIGGGATMHATAIVAVDSDGTTEVVAVDEHGTADDVALHAGDEREIATRPGLDLLDATYRSATSSGRLGALALDEVSVYKLRSLNKHAPGTFSGYLKKFEDADFPAEQITALREAVTGVYEYNDKGNARRLIGLHGRDLRYVPSIGRWHCWDGTRWRPDDDLQVKRLAKWVTDEMRLQAARDENEALSKWAFRSGGGTHLKAMVELAQDELPVIARVDQLDADPMLLNVANGTIDLRTGKLRRHNRSNLITKLTPILYDPDAACPRWMRFLDEVFDEDDDDIAFVRRAVGYSLTGITREQCMFMLVGDGANGKTTFRETIAALLGEYASNMQASSFTTEHRRSVRSDLARLPGVRFASASEMEHGSQLSEALIKELTGGDTITAAHLYKAEFDFKPQFKVWLAMNHLPVVRRGGDAMWRRIKVIPFTQVFDRRADKTLPEQLRAELSGILAWAVRGAVEWHADGLGVSSTVADETAKYRAESEEVVEADPAWFIEECCRRLEAAAFVPSDALHDAYVAWASEHETAALDKDKFIGLLRDLGFDKGRTMIDGVQKRGIKGLGLRTDRD